MYEDALQQAEVMNKSFQTVLKSIKATCNFLSFSKYF